MSLDRLHAVLQRHEAGTIERSTSTASCCLESREYGDPIPKLLVVGNIRLRKTKRKQGG